MFKAGDKVEVKGYTEDWDGKGVVEEFYQGSVIVSFSRPFPNSKGGFPHQYVHKIDNPSPIRTVTRREIVPGTYGKIFINDYNESANTVSLNVKDDFGCVYFTAEELRESAHIFNQLAEALEDKS